MNVTISETTNTVTVADNVSTAIIRAATAQLDSGSSVLFSDFASGNTTLPFLGVNGTVGNPTGGSINYSSDIFNTGIGAAGIGVFGTSTGCRAGIFASSGSETVVERGFKLNIFPKTRLKTRGYLNPAPQTVRVIVGYGSSHATSDVLGGTLMLQYGVAFVAYGSSGNWIATTADNNVLTEIDTGISSESLRELEIVISDYGNSAKWLIDGVVVREATGPFFADPAQGLAPGIEIRDKLAGGSSIACSYYTDYLLVETWIDGR